MATIPQRQAYGTALADYGEENQDVVALDADVSNCTFTSYFAARHPTRFFNVGVTETSIANIGVGMALEGRIPFVNTFASILTPRGCDAIRTCVAYARANVKLIGGYAGLSDYKDGPTHFGINDIALMRAMPNMVVITPADNVEAARMVRALGEHDGPAYMRVSRAVVPDVFDDSYEAQIGKGITLRSGSDVTLVGTGVMVARCLKAADALAKQGVDARVLAVHTVKPLDRELILKAAEETGALVTAEEHSIIGGLGSAVAETTAECWPAPLERVGLLDVFCETGPDPETLMDAWGLSVNDIAQAAMRVLQRKRS